MQIARYNFLRSAQSYLGPIELADELLHRVNLQHLRNKKTGDLAHGQQRALEIAMALACNPSLLLLDEPTAGMSPEETLVMMDLIRTLANERTVILVEHKMKLIMGLCKRIIVLHHGEFLAEGTPEEIKNNADDAGNDNKYNVILIEVNDEGTFKSKEPETHKKLENIIFNWVDDVIFEKIFKNNNNRTKIPNLQLIKSHSLFSKKLL